MTFTIPPFKGSGRDMRTRTDGEGGGAQLMSTTADPTISWDTGLEWGV